MTVHPAINEPVAKGLIEENRVVLITKWLHAAGTLGTKSRQQVIDNTARWRLGESLHLRLKDADAIGADPNLAHISLAVVDTDKNVFSYFGKRPIDVRFDAAASQFVAAPNSPSMAGRFTSFANLVGSSSGKGLFVANLADAQPWRYRAGDERFPVFQLSRQLMQREVILWPHNDWYMGPGSPHLPLENTDKFSFEDKKPMAVWRGVLSGTYVFDRRLIWAESIKKEMIEKGLALTSYNLSNSLCHFSRFRLAHLFCASTEVDVGLVHEKNNQHHKELITANKALEPWRRLFKEPMPRERQLTYRYILCPEGNDYSSGLFWALRSNSVVLMPVPRWQTILHFGLRPWEHYIPVKRDFSDVVEKIHWANQNLTRAKQISVQAYHHTNMQTDSTFRSAVDQRVLELYSDTFFLGNQGPHTL